MEPPMNADKRGLRTKTRALSAFICVHPRLPGSRGGEAGGALLAVLWLSTALSMIVFTLAWTVRGELERAANSLDGTRAYFLAEGAIERFQMHLLWGTGADPRDTRVVFRPGQRRVVFDFPSGTVDLEITGENGKLDVTSPPAILARLCLALGVDEGRAGAIAGGIAALSRASQEPNSSAGSSFSQTWPSFLQLEDLLKTPGMTPDIFYGSWDRDGEGRLVERGGVARHLTLLGDQTINVNYASPAVLRAVGVSEGRILELVQMREGRVIEYLPAGYQGAFGPVSLGGGGSGAYTVRATARLKDRPVRRSVAALIRLGRNRREPPLSVLRWYPTAN